MQQISEKVYFLTDLGGLCSDSNDQSLHDEDSCRKALAQMKQHDELEGFQTFYRKEDNYLFPKGCYTTPLDGGIHFNSNPVGDRLPMARQICSSGLDFYYYLQVLRIML